MKFLVLFLTFCSSLFADDVFDQLVFQKNKSFSEARSVSNMINNLSDHCGLQDIYSHWLCYKKVRKKSELGLTDGRELAKARRSLLISIEATENYKNLIKIQADKELVEAKIQAKLALRVQELIYMDQ